MSNALTTRQVVELFHLVFLRALYAGLGDKTLVALKGGINLRFYFGSVRFSEDLDLDVATMAKATLENKVDRLLVSPAIVAPLKARGIVIKDVSRPKQTETAQKWKLGVAALDASFAERTKIEFSRRDDVHAAVFERVDDDVTKRYSVTPFLATHYRTADAVRQKIHALMDRSETQPRDVFDLHVLFARADAPKALDEVAATWIDAAIANAEKLEYEDYEALVVTFLEPEHKQIYASRETWEEIQLDVISRIEALRGDR